MMYLRSNEGDASGPPVIECEVNSPGRRLLVEVTCESQVEAVPFILNPSFFDCKTGRSYQKCISKVIPFLIRGESGGL